MPRERIEDLGRLLAMLQQILEDAFFERDSNIRSKDFLDEFRSWSEEFQSDWISEEVYGKDRIKELLWECHSICCGQDRLNQSDDIRMLP